jgi:uncharacterized protein GlcG (DUF336 family)
VNDLHRRGLVPALVAGALVTTTLGACSRVESRRPAGDPAETQAGSASEQSRGPREGAQPAACKDLPSAEQLRTWLRQAPDDGGDAGGLFSGKMEWASLVDRDGELCATVVATDEPSSAWPGSQAVSKAKAYTANAYSTDSAPLSTARLYTLTQPGHSLWGVAEPNPFNPACLEAPRDASKTNGRICGGSIAFGGGVALYRNKTRIGGLGVSGDTACADHEIAKRIRNLADLNPEKGQFADDITFSKADGPSVYTHPLCANTWRNGSKIGDEPNATGY